MPNLLLLSPYDGMSHRYWRESLSDYLNQHLEDAHLYQLTMPARFFSWRQRGNSLGFALGRQLPGKVDLIIATSMTDLSALRGLSRQLAAVPAIVYFHENQFAYPDSHPKGLIERQLTSIYTALSADKILFNSRFNHESFLAGATRLLKKMPDEVPGGVIETLSDRADVLPVALTLSEFSQYSGPERDEALSDQADERVRIAWNHRWEADKGPDLLLDIVKALLARSVDFELSLFGEQFRQVPKELEQLQTLLTASGRLKQVGFVADRQAYLKQLSTHHIVLSTATQEFQGLAVQEAMLLGCRPVVPDALSYVEYVPDVYRYQQVDQAVTLIEKVQQQGISPYQHQTALLSDYDWSTVGPCWLALIAELIKPQ